MDEINGETATKYYMLSTTKEAEDWLIASVDKIKAEASDQTAEGMATAQLTGL